MARVEKEIEKIIGVVAGRPRIEGSQVLVESADFFVAGFSWTQSLGLLEIPCFSCFWLTGAGEEARPPRCCLLLNREEIPSRLAADVTFAADLRRGCYRSSPAGTVVVGVAGAVAATRALQEKKEKKKATGGSPWARHRTFDVATVGRVWFCVLYFGLIRSI